MEGNGIDLDMSSNFTKILDRNRSIYQQWYQSFIDNIHLLNFHPNKWLKSSQLPKVNDVVIFVFNDSNYTKDSICWRMAKVVEVGLEILHQSKWGWANFNKECKGYHYCVFCWRNVN